MAPYINWLASYPKSGSTWVRAFLEHYETGKIDINKMDVVLGDERVYYFQAVTAQPYHTFDLYQWAMIRPAALQMYISMNQKRDRLILKTHNAWATVGEIPLFPPLICGPSVYLVRDPVDVIPSFSQHTGKDIDDLLESMADDGHAFAANQKKNAMIGFLSSWSNHVKAWATVPDTIIVRYEDLQENPEYWFTQILKQFDYEVNKTKVLAAIDAVSLARLKEQEQTNGFTETGKSDVFFGGTYDKLNPSQISKVVEYFGSVMGDYSYLNEELKHGCNY